MKTTLWCCVGFGFEKPYFHLPSLAEKKKDSILKFSMWNWKLMQKDGWKCIKVEVEIKPI